MTAIADYTDNERYIARELSNYLNSQKLDHRVVKEYTRISINFLRYATEPDGSHFNAYQREAHIKSKLDEFLTIDNNCTYRNTLAGLKKLFKFIDSPYLIESYKFRRDMPNFSIKSPSLSDMVRFGKAITNKRIQVYYYLGVVSAIRPEHLCRLSKNLFDTENRMINTWMKTFGKKNFFFSFYTQETKDIIEDFLKGIPENELLFPIGYRRIEFIFERASDRCGIRMTPKAMRKFTTNWLSRHGMIPMDVDAITSHLSHRVVATNYVDNAILTLRDEYDKVTKDLMLL